MGYTIDYFYDLFEFWFSVILVFLIIDFFHNGYGSCRHLRGIGDYFG